MKAISWIGATGKWGYALLFVAFILWQQCARFSPDPDRLYQLAISREVALRGAVLENIPQAEDIGWASYFPDKEFGYHLLTGFGYSLGRDHGALTASALIAMALLLLCFWLMRRRAEPWSALLFIAVFLFTPIYLWRLGNLKPLEIGLLCFLLLLGGLLRSSQKMALTGALLYPMSYHLVPLPLALIACFWICNARSKEAGRFALLCLVALGVGILLNPYFPSNLSFVRQSIWTVKNVLTQPKLDFGVELLQFDLRSWLLFFGFPAALSVYALKQSKIPSFLAVFTVFLWCLSWLSPRALEYALPVSAVACAYSVPSLAGRRGKILSLLACSFLVIQFYSYFAFEPRNRNYQRLFLRHQETIDAVLRIPAEASGQKVFHCGWEMGPYIFYLRPDLRFVDLLDPAFLYLHAPEKWETKQRIHRGEQSEALAKTVFHADYYLCDTFLPGKKPLYEGKTGIRLYDLTR